MSAYVIPSSNAVTQGTVPWVISTTTDTAGGSYTQDPLARRLLESLLDELRLHTGLRQAATDAAGNMRVSGTVGQAGSSTATTPVQTPVGTGVAQLLAPNSSRRRLLVQNTGTTVLYLSLGPTAPTTTAYHVALAACSSADDGSGGTYVDEMWGGVVRATSSASGGTCVVTELT
jgi:hypothetical protein